MRRDGTPSEPRRYGDWEGHPALYCMHVEKLVEKTEAETG